MENLRSLLPILGLTNLGRTLLGEKGTKSPVGCGEHEQGFEPSTQMQLDILSFFSRCKHTMLQSNITSGCKQTQVYSLVAIRHIFIFFRRKHTHAMLQTTKEPGCNHTHAMLQTNTTIVFAN
jgi:hypothetical protein